MAVILHIDIDNFFVSAHQILVPQLANKPVVVSHGYQRSVISAANLEAKKRGIKVPIPFYKAKKLVPDLIMLIPNFDLYKKLSNQMFELIEKITNKKLEKFGLDECYLNITRIWKPYRSIKKMMLFIKDQIKEKLQLDISLGSGPNKIIAKMATNLGKPNGIKILSLNKYLNIFKNTNVKELYLVGKSTYLKLESMNIKTIGDLRNTNYQTLISNLGQNGHCIYQFANGIGPIEINHIQKPIQSISHAITFIDGDKNNWSEIKEIIEDLSLYIVKKLKSEKMVAKVISVVIKDAGDKNIKAKSIQMTLNYPIDKFDDVFENAEYLFKKIWKGQDLKYISINLKKLIAEKDAIIQLSIFDIFKQNE